MNYKDPKDRNFINKIVQEYIDIQDQKGRQFSILYTKERLIKQFKDLKDQLIDSKELTTEKLEEYLYQYYRLIKTIITYFIPKSKLNEYCYLEFRRKHQRIPTVEELLEGTYNNNKERTQEPQLSETEKAYLNRTLLALEGARNIQENDQATQIIFSNTGLTQATQDYLLQHHTQLVLETSTTRRNPRTNNLEIIGTPIITEAIGVPLQTAFGQYTLIQITDDIWNTINDLIDRINPTNNSRLGAILLTLEGAKSIAREFYPHILEYDKQRPNRIPLHILTRTATLFPDLTGRELAEEQKKQRNIYNNFLDNTQVQIEGIKKRLLAESPEFCKIFEENPETEETEFYYGDYNNQFTILPFRFHHLILHHLEAIDNILYSEGARNKIYFEEEESYISAYMEINKLSQEFLDQKKKVKKLKKEKERLEQATDKIIKRILLKNNKPTEKPKRTRSNSL
ncbi:hypothetical protein C2G38_2171589 [Gigaspora rosea]|uniref:Uncharacterized protein n=1 Tax=Gigaspora rosea TaxID=44941 RepID=A0A397VNI6_9GLOM|nr:hypothetical protein C2G38_2171589 [Gigaspora rosea]